MKHLLIAIILLTGLSLKAQNKFYATVFDEDNNPVARGLFKSAADSGVIIVVDGMEIFINASEITTLKIEKNPSKSEFLKLGASAATEAVTYLINKPKPVVSNGTDSVVAEVTAGGEEPVLSTETKAALLERLNHLLQDLLNGTNDVARFSINNSPEKFLNKLHLLQQYSIDTEIVHWADMAGNEQPAPVSNDANSQVNQTATPAEPSSGVVKIPTSKTIVLNKGIRILSKPQQASQSSAVSHNNNQAPSPDVSQVKTGTTNENVSSKSASSIIIVGNKPKTSVTENKGKNSVPAHRTTPPKKNSASPATIKQGNSLNNSISIKKQ